MRWVMNIGTILGALIAANTIIALVVDKESTMGKFYERIWYHELLGQKARPNTFDPFADGPKFVIFHRDNLSNVERDFEAIREVVGGAVYVASSRNSYNGDQPQGVLTFSASLSDAEHRLRLMQQAVDENKPKIEIRGTAEQPVIVSSGGTSIDETLTLEMFCRDHQTFEPAVLCF